MCEKNFAPFEIAQFFIAAATGSAALGSSVSPFMKAFLTDLKTDLLRTSSINVSVKTSVAQISSRGWLGESGSATRFVIAEIAC